MKLKLLILGFLVQSYALAQTVIPATELFQRSEQHQAVIDRQLTSSKNKQQDISIPNQQKTINNFNSNRCFPIETITINTLDDKEPLANLANYVAKVLTSEGYHFQKKDKLIFIVLDKKNKAPCFATKDIQKLSTDIQNELISKGWVTSRVLTPKQSLTDGNLELTLVKGLLNDIIIDKENSNQTHANRAKLVTAFPKKRKELNLRDLEQGLDNLRRLPTVKASMNITPSDKPNSSDIDIKWQQKKYPVRVNLSIDDSGDKSTGKYLGTVSTAWDNPLHLNDILSASYTHSLVSGTKSTDKKGNSEGGKTNSYKIGYSIPLGYWLFDANMNHYYYDQVVGGVNRNYHYTGNSDQVNVNLSKVIHRDNQNKITASIGGWSKKTKSYVDDVELEIQRRQTAGWKASLSHNGSYEKGSIASTLGYKRGTGAFGAIPAPEEAFNEGTAKAGIWTADINWEIPFKLDQHQLNWTSKWHAQLNQTDLTPQDKFSIGNRYNVRGFNGENSLSAERGFYNSNDINWKYHKNHQAYLGLDVGKVSGKSTKEMSSDTLVGVALGVKGQFQKKGDLNYDLFIAHPIKKPKTFKEDNLATGFNISYSF